MARHDNKPRRGGMTTVLAISLGVQATLLGAFLYFEPLRKSNMEMNLEEVKERAKEVEEKAKKRREKEREEREDKKLKEEDKKKLVDEERKKHEKELKKRVKKLDEIKREMEEVKKAQLDELNKRGVEDLKAQKARDLVVLAQELRSAADRYENRTEDQRADTIEDQAKFLLQRSKELVDKPMMSIDDMLAAVAEIESHTDTLSDEINRARKADDKAAEKALGGSGNLHRVKRDRQDFAEALQAFAQTEAPQTEVPDMEDQAEALAEQEQQLKDELKEQLAELKEKSDALNEDSQDERAEEIAEATEAMEELAESEQTESLDFASAQQQAEALSEDLESDQTAAESAQDTSAMEELGSSERSEEYQQAMEAVASTMSALESVQNQQEALDGLSDEQLDQMPLEQLHDMAKALEQAINNEFADVRAAEMANINGESFEEAREKTAMAEQPRMELSQAASEMVETMGDLNQLREQMAQAANEARTMEMGAQDKLNQAQGLAPQSQSQSGQQSQSAAQQAATSAQARQAIASAASMQHSNSTMVDLSAIMQSTFSSNGGSGDQEGGYTSDAMDNQGGAALSSQAAPTSKVRVNTGMIKAKAMPGRKFTKESARQGWLYLDTFYVIGPWKGGNANWSDVHPPETYIDLDAEYPSDHKKFDGEMLTWQFTQSEKMRITPPNEEGGATYYAYTEVYFEQSMDMLLAIASDDAAKVWINDLLVWQDQGLSAWKLDEGFRKVHFKQGFNKILLRIENGPVVCQYSVLLCPPELAK